MIIYLDTSALAAMYLGDHAAAAAVTDLVYHGETPVVTSELTDIEITSALARAYRDKSIDSDTAAELRARYQHDTSDDGPIGIIPLRSDTVEEAQQHLWSLAAIDPVTTSTPRPSSSSIPLRTLDATHLAACTLFADATGQQVHLYSLDARQNAAAHALQIPTAT